MSPPPLHAFHDFHQALNAQFTEVNGLEAVAHYGDPPAEYRALREAAGVIDLSFRGRLCLTGNDRQRFLNGQVTNNVKDLQPGAGCYAALTTAKGKMQSDLNIYCLPNELLLDFEPGFTETIISRLEKYIIADDVQVVNVAPHYGLLSVQGPQAAVVLRNFGVRDGPAPSLSFITLNDPTLGEMYFMNHARTLASGWDCYLPAAALAAVADKLIAAARDIGGGAIGWQALETARIEAGIPRFGVDMDDSNFPPEAGIENRAVSYTKGCYIGQEVIARIRTYGQVAKSLRGLRLADDLKELPHHADKLYRGDKEIGYVTSALASPALKSNIALGYVRREHNQIGAEVTLRTVEGESPARIVELPFQPEPFA